MRILTITHNYPRWAGDRAGAFVARLAAEIVELGHEIRVVAPHAPGARMREVRDGVQVVRARYGPDALERVGYTGALREPMRATMLAPLMLPPFIARLWSVAAREAKDFRPDVVHAHWWLPSGWIASRIGVPYIVTCHGTDVRMLESSLWRRVAAPVFHRASAVTAASGFLARDVAGVFPDITAKTSVTAMPMDLEMFERGAQAEKTSPARVLFAGNLIASKGVDVLIEAISMLRARGVSCQLRIIGAGPEEARLRALVAQHALGDAVTWSPFVLQHELPQELGAATVTVLVSRGQAEGLGLVLAEALMAGSAVVGTAAGGIPEVVVDEQTGLIARDGDAADLARQIERLLTSSALREHTIANGRERVRAQHAPVAAAKRVVALYDMVAKARTNR
jgi:glycosyltransferase involved in cell wall biosynthesis